MQAICRVFKAEHLAAMRELFSRICADFEAEFIEFDGEDDRVHLLAHYPPKVSISALVNGLEGGITPFRRISLFGEFVAIVSSFLSD